MCYICIESTASVTVHGGMLTSIFLVEAQSLVSHSEMSSLISVCSIISG